MLEKFTVKNFKNFDNTTIDFTASEYKFNDDSIKNKLVNNAIIYGKNSSGKSNIGFAIFDISRHLTNNGRENFYKNFLNKNNQTPYAEFEYYFKFDKNNVVYKYSKKENGDLIDEKLEINKNIALSIKRKGIARSVNFSLQGTNNLNQMNLYDTDLSIIQYVKNNAILEKNQENSIFEEFYEFVQKMLFFRSLKDNAFIGIENNGSSIDEYIISSGKVKDFELFLNIAGIECKLEVISGGVEEELVFDFNGEYAKFFEVASQGTIALSLFYFWYQRIKKNTTSLVFIDEFDAFYHHSLSKFIVKKLKEVDVQVVFTTHNTSIMTNDLLRPDCYYLVNSGKIESINKLTDRELREVHNLEKLYKSNLFS
jgi:AAA15 family ATPase/GTPase